MIFPRVRSLSSDNVKHFNFLATTASCLKLNTNLTSAPSGVAEEDDEEAGVLTGDLGTHEGWSRAEVALEDAEVSEEGGFSCVWDKTWSTTHPE